MAFFPANATYPSMLGELYSAAFTAPAFNWICSPAVTELETIVLDWLARLIGLPPSYQSDVPSSSSSSSASGSEVHSVANGDKASEGGGVIQGSASEAVVTVMVAAREKYLRETIPSSHPDGAPLSPRELEDLYCERRARLVALGSDTSHSSTQKAAQIAGVRFRTIPTSSSASSAASADAEGDEAEKFNLTGSALAAELHRIEIEEGLEPFYVTATLGTTSTCAVDDMAGIAQTVSEWRQGKRPDGTPRGPLWVHIDAAYAGAALICPELRPASLTAEGQVLNTFNSFNLNLHKWLLVSFDASCLYVRHRSDLISALSITPSYLRNPHTESGLVTDYRDWQIPLGRRFRSLKVWFVLRSYGIAGMQAHIRHTVALGDQFGEWLGSRPDLFKIVAGPSFALNVFAVVPSPGRGDDNEGKAADKLTKMVYETINARGLIYITSSVVGGRYVIRVVSASPQTEEKHLRRAFEILVFTVEEIRDGKVDGAGAAAVMGGTATPEQFEDVGKGLGEAEEVGRRRRESLAAEQKQREKAKLSQAK
jgi:aromatic-L-amino-acid decarboxylase